MPLFCISWQDFPRDYDVAAPLRGRRDGRGGSFNCDGCRPGIVTQQPHACPLRCLIPMLGFGGRRRGQQPRAVSLQCPFHSPKERVITSGTCSLGPLGHPTGLTDTPSLPQQPSQDRTSAKVSCLTNPPPFFAGIGHARPQSPDFPYSLGSG